jgi:DNA-binding Lrp family transcriptional regulator
MYENETIDAYLFFDGATQEWLDDLLGLAQGGETPIRYAAVLTGGADAIAAGEFESLPQLGDFVDSTFRATALPSVSTAIGLCPPPPRECKMPKKKRCERAVEAFVRIWAEPGRADAVVDDLLAIDGIDEAGAVAGDFDVLTVLCVPTIMAARALLVDQVQRVPSIVRTSTAFVLRSASSVPPTQA